MLIASVVLSFTRVDSAWIDVAAAAVGLSGRLFGLRLRIPFARFREYSRSVTGASVILAPYGVPYRSRAPAPGSYPPKRKTAVIDSAPKDPQTQFSGNFAAVLGGKCNSAAFLRRGSSDCASEDAGNKGQGATRIISGTAARLFLSEVSHAENAQLGDRLPACLITPIRTPQRYTLEPECKASAWKSRAKRRRVPSGGGNINRSRTVSMIMTRGFTPPVPKRLRMSRTDAAARYVPPRTPKASFEFL